MNPFVLTALLLAPLAALHATVTVPDADVCGGNRRGLRR